jgi:hypothetical protein
MQYWIKGFFIILCILEITALHAAVISTDQESDIEKIVNTRKAFEQMQSYMHQRKNLFIQKKTFTKSLTSREQRQEIWLFWQGFLDRIIMLDMLGGKYEQRYKNSNGEAKKENYRVAYSVFLLQYRYAVEIISTLENDPAMHTILNEPVPELGLDKNTYKKLKFRFLNAARAGEFTRLGLLYNFYGKNDDLVLTEGIESDAAELWKLGLGEGTAQTFKNALTIVQDTGFTVWFPLQSSVSEWMGDVKIFRKEYSFITVEQIDEMEKLLLPGDILLERREWYLSNIGLPGYWPHAALYIGTAEQRSRYFDDDSVKTLFADNHDFESTLQSQYPGAYTASKTPDHYGHLPRVIEAISEGVLFTTLEHSVDADSVAILRPKLSKLEKAQAIKRAFHFSGRPYDFDFDFLTDSELVCTELIYKAYEPDKTFTGIKFPTRKILGRTVVTANDMVEMVDDEHERDKAQLELIVFYDGHERRKSAVKSDLKSFRDSWKRPKMFIWVQDTILESKHN